MPALRFANPVLIRRTPLTLFSLGIKRVDEIGADLEHSRSEVEGHKRPRMGQEFVTHRLDLMIA